jgi:AraC-like protein
MNSAQPLARFPVVSTSDLEELRAGLERANAAPALELVGRARAIRTVLNGCRLQHIRLNYGWYSDALRMRFTQVELASQIFAIGGKAGALIKGISATIDSDHSVIVSPGEALTFTNLAESARLVLAMNPVALATKLSAIAGKFCREPLKFDPIQRNTHPAARALRSHFLFLVEQVSTSVAPLPKLVLDEFEQSLIVMFLHANRHNYSQLLEQTPPEVAPEQVRRAEEYIEANWQRAIMLEDLAQVAGVSAFSLFRSFKKSRGYSPMQFLAQVRSRRMRTPP